MKARILIKSLVLIASVCLSSSLFAAPQTYSIDSAHTYPSFEADHQGGLSLWRGKINSTTGEIVLDKEAGTGSVDVTMDINSIDFGHEGMNNRAKNDIFIVKDFPNATYTGALTNFVDGAPTSVEGEMTLKGVTKPLTLTIHSFLCKPHFRTGKEVCGADASAEFSRADWGVDYGLDGAHLPEVKLLISIEANIQE